MKNVIITGAGGFVVSYTVKYFLNEGKTVLALYSGPSARGLEEHPSLKYMQYDISDTKDMLDGIEKGVYDTFIHFAWAGSAGDARFDYKLQMQNVLNTVECMKATRELGCARFVCAGSIMEYEVEATIHAQGSKPGMGYIYGMGKYIAYCMCKTVAVNSGIELVWSMITNTYGVGDFSPRFVNSTLRKIINGEPLQFTATTQNYDFVYVTDVAKDFYLVADKGKPYCEYTIDSGDAKPLKEFILEMVGACGSESTPLFGDVPFTGTNMPLDTFSIEKIKNDCGFIPEVSFAEGTKFTMDWLKTI